MKTKNRKCSECRKFVRVPLNVDRNSDVFCSKQCYVKQYPELAFRLMTLEGIDDFVIIKVLKGGDSDS